MFTVIIFFKPKLGHMVIKYSETFEIENVPEKLVCIVAVTILYICEVLKIFLKYLIKTLKNTF